MDIEELLAALGERSESPPPLGEDMDVPEELRPMAEMARLTRTVHGMAMEEQVRKKVQVSRKRRAWREDPTLHQDTAETGDDLKARWKKISNENPIDMVDMGADLKLVVWLSECSKAISMTIGAIMDDTVDATPMDNPRTSVYQSVVRSWRRLWEVWVIRRMKHRVWSRRRKILFWIVLVRLNFLAQFVRWRHLLSKEWTTDGSKAAHPDEAFTLGRCWPNLCAILWGRVGEADIPLENRLRDRELVFLTQRELLSLTNRVVAIWNDIPFALMGIVPRANELSGENVASWGGQDTVVGVLDAIILRLGGLCMAEYFDGEPDLDLSGMYFDSFDENGLHSRLCSPEFICEIMIKLEDAFLQLYVVRVELIQSLGVTLNAVISQKHDPDCLRTFHLWVSRYIDGPMKVEIGKRFEKGMHDWLMRLGEMPRFTWDKEDSERNSLNSFAHSRGEDGRFLSKHYAELSPLEIFGSPDGWLYKSELADFLGRLGCMLFMDANVQGVVFSNHVWMIGNSIDTRDMKESEATSGANARHGYYGIENVGLLQEQIRQKRSRQITIPIICRVLGSWLVIVVHWKKAAQRSFRPIGKAMAFATFAEASREWMSIQRRTNNDVLVAMHDIFPSQETSRAIEKMQKKKAGKVDKAAKHNVLPITEQMHTGSSGTHKDIFK